MFKKLFLLFMLTNSLLSIDNVFSAEEGGSGALLENIEKEEDREKERKKTLIFKGRLHLSLKYDDEKNINSEIFGVERARIQMIKKLGDNFNLSFTLFLAEKPALNEAFFYYTPNNNFKFEMGSLKVINNMSYAIGSNYSVIPEGVGSVKSLEYPDGGNHGSITGKYNLGIASRNFNDTFSNLFGVYSNSIYDRATETKKLIISNRFSYHPTIGENQKIHLGINTYTGFDFKDYDTQFSNNYITDARFYNLFKVGAEFAYRYKSFLFQSEYEHLFGRLNKGEKKYLQLFDFNIIASLLLTGEYREYKNSDAIFVDVDVIKSPLNKGGIGAWELFLRYELMDSEDTITKDGNRIYFDEGVENIFSMGTTWIPYNFMRVIVNYSFVNRKFYNKKTINNNIYSLFYKVYF